MRRYQNPFLLACILISIPSLFSAEPGAWSSYRNDAQGYRLDYPRGWQVVEARLPTGGGSFRDGQVLVPGELQQVTFIEPASTVWPGELVVTVHEFPDQRSLDEWADETFTDVYDESLVTDAEVTVLAGRSARRFSVFGFDHTEIVVALARGGKIYELSFAGTNPNDPDVDSHMAIYRRMQGSFALFE